VESRNYTQDELIAFALDTKEGNIVEHRNYLKNEAEKRKPPRVIRMAVSWSLIRCISKKEEAKAVVPPPPPSPPPFVIPQAPVSSIYRGIYGPPGSLFTPTTYSYLSGTAVVTTAASTSTPEIQFKFATPAAAQKTPYSASQHYLDMCWYQDTHRCQH